MSSIPSRVRQLRSELRLHMVAFRVEYFKTCLLGSCVKKSRGSHGMTHTGTRFVRTVFVISPLLLSLIDWISGLLNSSLSAKPFSLIERM